jgi:hypothetical protein
VNTAGKVLHEIYGTASSGDDPPRRAVSARRRGRVGKGIANAMTVDVEDYFQVEAFASTVNRDDWDRLPRRVERNTGRLLDILD